MAKIDEALLLEARNYIHNHPGMRGLALGRKIRAGYLLELEVRDWCEYRSDLGTNDRGWFCLCAECKLAKR